MSSSSVRGPQRLAFAALTAAAAFVVAACAPAASGDDRTATGGIAVVALVGEPGVFNPMFSTESSSEISAAFVVEPLFTMMGDGTYVPILAETIPTIDNGDISADGRTVTYRLREGITWSDGEPLTAEDLAFTVAVAQDPDGAALADPEYDGIVETQVQDDLSLAVTFAEPEPGFLGLFAQIMPAHRFASSAVGLDDPLVRLPLGTGPFVFDEWRSGDEVTLVRNDAYWLDPALPVLDGVTLKITPDKQVALAGFLNGDYDTVDFFSSGDFAEIERAISDGAPLHVQLDTRYPGYVEYLWLNHSDGGDPSTPHPVLSDPAVREAIDLAIDRQTIVDELLGGYGVLTGAFLSSGFGSVPRAATTFDPEAAEAVLDAAGWRTGDDGVREKDGVRASLRFQTIAGDQDRVLYQQLIQQNLADIGIETVIDNVPAGRLFDGHAEGGLLATGDYDLVMSRDGRYADPGLWVYTFTEHSIPSEQNGFQGFTYSHWRNGDYDAIGYEASITIDPAERAALLAEVDEIFVSERVAIPVFATVLGLAWNDALGDVRADYWQGIWNTDGTAHWTLAD